MKFNIPVSKLDRLQKKVNRIINKAHAKGLDAIVFEVGDEVQVEDENVKGVFHRCVEVEASGEYVINGWQFVGTIEHKGNGNIIRCVVPELESDIPAKYRTSRPYCEHCNTVRARKDTYLIRNVDTGEYKQVGKQCLMEYTRGLSAEACTEIMSVIDACVMASEYDEEDVVECFRAFGNSSYLIDTDEIKHVAYGYVRDNGYVGGGVTAETIVNVICKTAKDVSFREATDEEIEAMDEWVKTVDAEYGYMYNAKVAWTSEYSEFRDVALIASLVAVYLREMSKLAQRKADMESRNNEWVGDVGDRITVKVAKARVLYTRDNSHKSYYAGCSYVWEIVDEQGHTFKWSASCDEILPGNTIVATVKGHEEYKGTKQTVITRGKVSE